MDDYEYLDSLLKTEENLQQPYHNYLPVVNLLLWKFEHTTVGDAHVRAEYIGKLRSVQYNLRRNKNASRASRDIIADAYCWLVKEARKIANEP